MTQYIANVFIVKIQWVDHKICAAWSDLLYDFRILVTGFDLTHSHHIQPVHLSSRRDDHGFSPMHWASKEGHLSIVEMLISRGAKINSTNMGDDTALHLSAAHGHREIVTKVGIFAKWWLCWS